MFNLHACLTLKKRVVEFSLSRDQHYFQRQNDYENALGFMNLPRSGISEFSSDRSMV